MKAEHKKVLIVEDEVIVAMELEMHLKAKGLKIIDKVQSLEKAIEVAKRELPDLILMDINIYGNGDGIDAAKAILSFSKPAIIFLTAYNDSDTIGRAGKIPGSRLLIKPFLAGDLLSTIENILSDRKK